MNESLNATKKIDSNDPYKRSRVAAIIQAALEYFISILVGTTYLSKLALSIGLPDGVIGILNSFISLGTGFQIFSLFFAHKKPVKRFISMSFLVIQLGFAFLYVIPIIDVSPNVKSVIFILLLLVVEILKSIIYPAQMNWFYSVVDDKKRSSFTAKKEIVSLLTGVVFTFIMGRTIDFYEKADKLNVAFILCGVSIFVIMILHSVSLIFIKEKNDAPTKNTAVVQLKAVLSNKKLYKIIPVFILTNIAHYVSMPFYGTYQQNELGFSMTFLAVLSFLYAIIRSAVSIPMSKIADKYNFATMLTMCHCLMVLAYGMNIFFGKGFYIAYYLIYAIAMAGINSCVINLVYDYVPRSQRTGAIAVKNSVSGFIGFFTALLARPIVDHVQKNGNKFLFFDKIYAQQILSAISVVVTIVLIIYLNTVVRKMKKEDSE